MKLPSAQILITLPELAELLKVSQKTIYYWVSREEIPYLKVGKHLRFSYEEILLHFRKETENSKPTCFQNELLLTLESNRSLKTRNSVPPSSTGD